MDKIAIDGMSCQHCVGSVKTALEALPGLSAVEVDLAAKEARFTNQGVSREEIRAAIEKIGFTAGN